MITPIDSPIAAISQSSFPIRMVPIRMLFNDDRQQVCSSNGEVCPFYVVISLGWGACNHASRGIINFLPHRLCPVLL